MRLFVDLDGVLADLNGFYLQHYGVIPDRDGGRQLADFRRNVARHPGGFFRQLPLMPDARELWDAVKHLEPTILTGLSTSTKDCAEQKIDWCARHFPGTPVITTLAKDKRLHGRPGDILIDDWARYSDLWMEMGGLFVLHVSAEKTINILLKHGVIWRFDR